ncbi:MAG: hypothetical protein U0787_04715 [Polyangia bacterium]
MQSVPETEPQKSPVFLRGLGGIVGQDNVVSVLRSALIAKRPHHAYLFDGPEGVGKATTARALAAALNCLAPPAPGDACGSCEACHKLQAASHPDFITVNHGTFRGWPTKSKSCCAASPIHRLKDGHKWC